MLNAASQRIAVALAGVMYLSADSPFHFLVPVGSTGRTLHAVIIVESDAFTSVEFYEVNSDNSIPNEADTISTVITIGENASAHKLRALVAVLASSV